MRLGTWRLATPPADRLSGHRKLYWATRTRHSAINLLAFLTQLLALVPDLEALLSPLADGQAPGDAALKASSSRSRARAAAEGRAVAGQRASAPRGPERGSSAQGGPSEGPLSAAERAALRQLVVRLMYDACRCAGRRALMFEARCLAHA
jgi:hypothetical protein